MQNAPAAESVFSSAMSNTLQWALGYPVNSGHYAMTFLLMALGGAFLFQNLAATFNARRYAWVFTGPCWALGLFTVVWGMTTALVNQPESLAGSARWMTCGLGALLAVAVICGPVTMLVMSMTYGAAVSIWITSLGAAAIVSGASQLVGASMSQGQPRVLHWEGRVGVRDKTTTPWKPMNDERRVLEEGFMVQVGLKSAAILLVEGHQILLLPGTEIRIPKTGAEPKVVLAQGTMFSRTTMSANRNMAFETATAGFKISNGSVLISTGRGRTSAVVSDGGVRAGRNIFEADTLVKKGHYIIYSSTLDTMPQPVSKEYREQLDRLNRYFENPFSDANRAMITGEKSGEEERKEEKKEEKKAMPEEKKPPAGTKADTPPTKSPESPATPAQTNAPTRSAPEGKAQPASAEK